jgi:hypothetical protein
LNVELIRQLRNPRGTIMPAVRQRFHSSYCLKLWSHFWILPILPFKFGSAGQVLSRPYLCVIKHKSA